MTPEEIGCRYDKIAQWWDATHRGSTYGLDALERALKWRPRPGKALDVGCGSGGRVIRRLQEAGYETTGIDVSVKMVEMARKNHPGVEFQVCDFLQWGASGLYDLVVAWDSLFHLPSALQEPAIRRLSLFLEEGGILLFSFGDAVGDHEDLSFRDPAGGQFGDLDGELFGYGSIGAEGVRRALEANGCRCLDLVLDQPPGPHAYVIAQQELYADAGWRNGRREASPTRILNVESEGTDSPGFGVPGS